MPSLPGAVPYPPADVKRFRAAGLWGERTIAQELRATAARHPDRDAVATVAGRTSYRELDARADLIAAGLHARGLRPGDRVLLQVGNSLDTVTSWYGVLKAGLVPVCSLAQHRDREIDELARQTRARAHLVETGLSGFDLVAFGRAVAARAPELEHLLTIGPSAAGDGAVPLAAIAEGSAPDAARALVDRVQAALDPDDVAVFQLSGGTTSVPKVIPRRHAEYWYNARAYAERWGWGPEVRVTHVAPIVHNAGVVCALHAAAAVGGCLVLPPREPGAAAALLAGEEVTDAMVNLALAQAIAADPALRAAYRSLRRLVFSGGPLPERVATEFERRPTRIVQLFGMAEGLFLQTPVGAPAAVRHRTVGVPASPLDEVRIYSPGGEDEVAPGELGELCCRGPYTIRGYYDAPERDREAFTRDGFYRSGDLARAVDVGGMRCYAIEGRIKDVINRAGEKVNAEEVELLLIEHPDIAAVALVAMEDDRLGERACAFVVPAAGAPAPALPAIQAFLERHGVAKFKWPERIEPLDALPVTSVGKVDKAALRRAIAAVLADERDA